MANVTITYNPKQNGKARVTTGVISAAHRRTMASGGFIFAPSQNVGFFSPGHAISDMVAEFVTQHSDALTLTESTAGYYDDTANQN